MNQQAQTRLKQIEVEKKRLLAVTNNTYLSQDERAEAVNKLRALLNEEDSLKSGDHWLRQSTTSNKILYEAVQKELQGKVTRS